MNLEEEIEKVKDMSELERIRYYKEEGICEFFQICPWKYVSLYYCHRETGGWYEDCLQRLEFIEMNSLSEINNRLAEKAEFEWELRRE